MTRVTVRVEFWMPKSMRELEEMRMRRERVQGRDPWHSHPHHCR